MKINSWQARHTSLRFSEGFHRENMEWILSEYYGWRDSINWY